MNRTLQSAGAWFVATYIKLIDRNIENLNNDKAFKTNFIRNIYLNDKTDKDIEGTRVRVNCVMKIINEHQIEEALNYIINSKIDNQYIEFAKTYLKEIRDRSNALENIDDFGGILIYQKKGANYSSDVERVSIIMHVLQSEDNFNFKIAFISRINLSGVLNINYIKKHLVEALLYELQNYKYECDDFNFEKGIFETLYECKNITKMESDGEIIDVTVKVGYWSGEKFALEILDIRTQANAVINKEKLINCLSTRINSIK